MFRRLLTAQLLLLLVSLAVFGTLSANATRDWVLAEIASRLEAQAEILRPVVRTRDRADLEKTLQEFGRRLGTHITVIGADGLAIADSHASPDRNRNNRPEVIQARAEGRGMNVRYSETVHEDMMYLAIPLEPANPKGSVVRCALPLTLVNEQVNAVYRAIVIAFVVIGIAAALTSYVLARRLTRPLREIRAVAQSIAAGDFSASAPRQATDEAGNVLLAIHRMGDELSARLAALKAESAKLEAVISSMQEGVLAVDALGVVRHANAAAKSLFEIEIDPLGLKVWEAIRRPSIEEAVGRVLREQTPARLQLELGSRVLAVTVRPSLGDRGAVLVAHDTTEQRRYDDLRKEFVANVSHELRTPIALIQGYVETLREGAWRDEHRAPEFLETLDRQVHRLSALVEDLLELSRLESTGQIAKVRAVEVKALVKRILDTYQPLAAKKRQTLSANPACDRLAADPELLERALSNLVENAIKYTPEGGTIRILAKEDADAVSFSVEDTGIGIPETDLPRIFERFYRVDKSRSRDLGGTGLGLAIVKHIAQLHGGSVSVQSKMGGGSAFTLRLPKR